MGKIKRGKFETLEFETLNKEVVAFPKTQQQGQDLMMPSPTVATKQQLDKLRISVNCEKMREERRRYFEGSSYRNFYDYAYLSFCDFMSSD